MITTGYELTTAVTNLLNAFITAVLMIRIHQTVTPPLRRLLWNLTFFLFLTVSLAGAAVHGIVMNQETYKLLWNVLYSVMGIMLAVFVTALMYEGYGPAYVKKTALTAGLLVAVFIPVQLYLETTYRIGFIGFIVYCLINIFLITLMLLKVRKQKTYLNWFLAGIFFLIAGSILQQVKSIKFHLIVDINYNVIYHLFILIFALLSYRGILEASRQTESGEPEESR